MCTAPTVKKMILNVSPLLGLNEDSAGTIIQESHGRAASFSEPNQVPVRAPQRMVAETQDQQQGQERPGAFYAGGASGAAEKRAGKKDQAVTARRR